MFTRGYHISHPITSWTKDLTCFEGTIMYLLPGFRRNFLESCGAGDFLISDMCQLTWVDMSAHSLHIALPCCCAPRCSTLWMIPTARQFFPVSMFDAELLSSPWFPTDNRSIGTSAHPCSDPTYFLNPWIPWFQDVLQDQRLLLVVNLGYFGLFQPRCFNQDVSRFSSSSHKINHGPPCFTEFYSRHRMNVMLQSILAKPSSQRTPAPPPGAANGRWIFVMWKMDTIWLWLTVCHGKSPCY